MRTFLNFNNSLFNSTAHFKSQTIDSQTRSSAYWNRSTAHDEDCGQEQRTHLISLLVAKIDLKFVNIWHSSQDHLKTWDFRKKQEDGSCPLKTVASRSKLESWNICIGKLNSGGNFIRRFVIELEPLKSELCSVLYVTSKLSYWRREKVIMFEKINEFVPAPEDSMQYINHLFITNDISEETRKKAIVLSSCGAGTYSGLKILQQQRNHRKNPALN